MKSEELKRIQKAYVALMSSLDSGETKIPFDMMGEKYGCYKIAREEFEALEPFLRMYKKVEIKIGKVKLSVDGFLGISFYREEDDVYILFPSEKEKMTALAFISNTIEYVNEFYKAIPLEDLYAGVGNE